MMQACTPAKGSAKLKIFRRELQRASCSKRDGNQILHSDKEKKKQSLENRTESIIPQRRMSLAPFLSFDASLAETKREMAVWIPDEVRENSRVWIGKRRR